LALVIPFLVLTSQNDLTNGKWRFRAGLSDASHVSQKIHHTADDTLKINNYKLVRIL